MPEKRLMILEFDAFTIEALLPLRGVHFQSPCLYFLTT